MTWRERAATEWVRLGDRAVALDALATMAALQSLDELLAAAPAGAADRFACDKTLTPESVPYGVVLVGDGYVVVDPVTAAGVLEAECRGWWARTADAWRVVAVAAAREGVDSGEVARSLADELDTGRNQIETVEGGGILDPLSDSSRVPAWVWALLGLWAASQFARIGGAIR